MGKVSRPFREAARLVKESEFWARYGRMEQAYDYAVLAMRALPTPDQLGMRCRKQHSGWFLRIWSALHA